MENNDYTGREIAIFADVHGLLEPAVAILDDIKKRGIKEIYSLGDNIGEGPEPRRVMDILGEYGVIQINGNSEDYTVLGTAPFPYLNSSRKNNIEWTNSELTGYQKEELNNNKHSYDLIVGGKNIGLCHFANDVRIDFSSHSTWSYQTSINSGISNPNEQFYYTNSDKQKLEIENKANSNEAFNLGYVSAKKDTLFNGKMVNDYDEIIQGHVHFKYLTEDLKSKIRTIRGAGIAYGENDPIDFASYIIIKERKVGYDVEEVLVSFDRSKMLKSIMESDMPDKGLITKYSSKR